MGRLHFIQQLTNGQFEVCKFILENVEDKNPKKDDGGTPLHSTAQDGNLDVCKLIFENVDDKNPKDEDE